MSEKDTTALLGISIDALYRRIKENHGMSFADYRTEKAAAIKVRLISKALALADKGDKVMLIFSLKNFCNWSDNRN